ncbi:hypothetical protein ABMA27_003458 [Loxostege sticticalis]|uniref:Gag protein n=1 Tax=Loxostege sticticalis TaxID=481309 RepID=A0ABR3HT60_LOXSC
MPKRSAEEEIAYYSKKLKKLKRKEKKRRKRVLVYSDSSEGEENYDVAINENTADDNNENIQPDNAPDALDLDQVLNTNDSNDVQPNQEVNPEPSVPDNNLPSLDPEMLIALGELIPEEVTYGEDIHPDLAQRWAPILRKGLTDKEQRDKLFKEYATPNNCKLFRATTLLASDNKVQAIRYLSDACRVLSDLHASETQTRTKSLTQGLDKSFLNLIQDTERDEMLFGNGLPEKIKASKAIEKQGSQIKKPDNKVAPGPSASRATRPQGNWRGPSRSTTNRGGGRGGSRRTPYANQKHVSTMQQNNFNPSRVWNKPPRAGPRT